MPLSAGCETKPILYKSVSQTRKRNGAIAHDGKQPRKEGRIGFEQNPVFSEDGYFEVRIANWGKNVYFGCLENSGLYQHHSKRMPSLELMVVFRVVFEMRWEKQ